MELFELPLWVRVYNLPFKRRTQRENVEAIGKKIGRYIKADCSGSVGIHKSIRLRINVDVRKPLTQKIKVKLRGGMEEFFEVKYEKPPLFCYFCGMIGRGVKDCMECRDEEEPQLQYGGWLKASPWKIVSIVMEHGRKSIEGSCARSLFITRPKQKVSVHERKVVNEVVGRLKECGLEGAGDTEKNDKEGQGEHCSEVVEGEGIPKIWDKVPSVDKGVGGDIMEGSNKNGLPQKKGGKEGLERVEGRAVVILR